VVSADTIFHSASGRTYSRIGLLPHLLLCGWYLGCPKDSTPTLEIPFSENIEPYFLEILASSVRTQVEGGRQKIISKGKGKLKEKVTEPPFSNTFVEVPLN
jgi:hypothetical protein